jgi:hypothetical protein
VFVFGNRRRPAVKILVYEGQGFWRCQKRLSKQMQELGFTYPDDMSSVILQTFRCKRYGQDFRLKERVAEYRKTYGIEEMTTEEEENRVKRAKAALPNRMMGLHFEKRDVPTVRIPDQGRYSLSVRFLSGFRGGAFIAAYLPGRQLMDDDVFTTPGAYFDAADRKIHQVRVPEINDVQSAVVVGQRAWFVGNTDGRAVLVGVNGQDRIVLRPPEAGSSFQLGIRDTGLRGPQEPIDWFSGDSVLIAGLYNTFSFCVTRSGDLWVCVGTSPNRKSPALGVEMASSLWRRGKEGDGAGRGTSGR